MTDSEKKFRVTNAAYIDRLHRDYDVLAKRVERQGKLLEECYQFLKDIPKLLDFEIHDKARALLVRLESRNLRGEGRNRERQA